MLNERTINTIESTNCPIVNSKTVLNSSDRNTIKTEMTNNENKGTTIFSFIISFKEGTACLPISLLYLYVHQRNGTILNK